MSVCLLGTCILSFILTHKHQSVSKMKKKKQQTDFPPFWSMTLFLRKCYCSFIPEFGPFVPIKLLKSLVLTWGTDSGKKSHNVLSSLQPHFIPCSSLSPSPHPSLLSLSLAIACARAPTCMYSLSLSLLLIYQMDFNTFELLKDCWVNQCKCPKRIWNFFESKSSKFW